MATPRLRQLALCVLVTGYFLYFSFDSVRVRFAPDDMANMAAAWRLPPIELLLAPLMPWGAIYRPLAGWFYVALLHFFGLDPVPYHVIILAVLLAAVLLVYRLARLLNVDGAAATVAALLVCYHAGLSNLTYNIAFVYDALCGFFYLAALVCYIDVRRRGRLPGWSATFGILALYLCALQSKEMAVTLPAIFLVYEWQFANPPAVCSFRGWLRGPARTALYCAALTLPYLYSRLWRPDSLLHDSGYRISLSFAGILDFQIRSLADLFLKSHFFTWWSVLVVWSLLTFLAWRRPRPELRFCWFFLLLTPLPIEFLVGRNGACLYIPMAGWAIFMAVLLVDFARELAMKRLRSPLLFVLILSAGVFLWARRNQEMKRRFVEPAMADLGRATADAIGQFQSLHAAIPHGATVVFLNDPFAEWDMAFIAELSIRDRSVMVRLNRKTPLAPDEIARATAVFDYREGKLIQVR